MIVADTNLEERVAELERQLLEARETLDAIRNGEVDAVVVGGPDGQFVYTLENADRPYRVLVEQMQEGAVTLDGEGLILYANRSFSALLGRAPSDLVGSNILALVSDATLLEGMFDRDRPPSVELRLTGTAGLNIPVNLSIVELQVEENAPRMLCAIVTDLTHNYARAREVKLAHARLAERTAELETSEARLRAVFDTSFQLQGLLGPDGTLLDANSIALEAIDAKLPEVVGRPYWKTPWFAGTPGMTDTIKAAVKAVARKGAFRTELLVNLPVGGWRTLDFSLRAIRDAHGELTAMVPEGVDLTDMRRAEEALRQAQKLEAIGQLTGGVAHDFNNLLTVIKGSVDLLQRGTLTDEKRRRYIDAIGETADRATRLTGQLLAFARRQALKPEAFDVGASLQNVRGIVTSLTGARIELEINVPDEPCFVLADRSQFDTAIVNMAINARDAMSGEGKIIVSTEAVSGYPAVRHHDPVRGDFIAISVSDTGSGIAGRDLERVFEPFFTTKGVGSGTGLGLSQVFGFAKQSDGEIRLESTVGAGTTFTLYLPRVRDHAPSDPVEMSDRKRGGEGICVLIVEDNPDVGTFATQALKELGYDSRLARDADAALEMLEDDCDRFHIVFSDVIMPGRSGLELAEEIRERFPAIPVVLASGYSDVLANGGTSEFELVHKPYSIDQLSEALHTALQAGRRSVP